MRYFIVIFACIVGLNCLLFVFITLFQCRYVAYYPGPSLVRKRLELR